MHVKVSFFIDVWSYHDGGCNQYLEYKLLSHKTILIFLIVSQCEIPLFPSRVSLE